MSVRYVAVRVNDNQNNLIGSRLFYSICEAINNISLVLEKNGDWWRVVEIPSNEPPDFDGTVVAEIKTGRLF